MQYLNDDMDELFRRAAKDYPLNTNSADWEKLKNALQDSSDDNPKKPSKGNSKRHFLWLLMLLPLPWICNRYSGEVGNGDSARNTITKAPAVREIKTSIKEGENNIVINESASKPTKIARNPTNSTLDFDLNSNNSTYAVAPKTRQKQRQKGVYQESNDLDHHSVDKQTLSNTDDVEESGVKATTSTNVQSKQEATEISKEVAPKQQEDNKISEKETNKADSISTESAPVKQQKPNKQKRFYAGVLGGIDVTSVKMQEVKNVGYDAGIILGYQVNNRWSVETGLLSSEKAYYSKGEYLPKAYLLPNTKLKEANGDCLMWEVPLLVRYQFKEGKKGGWFAAAGASSYFMNKEDYYYTYYYPTTGQEVERYRSYKKNHNHLFAAAQVSGGYNRNIGKTMGVSIEPYLKVPLKKVGYYDLPLTSFGVHVGVTKKLF